MTLVPRANLTVAARAAGWCPAIGPVQALACLRCSWGHVGTLVQPIHRVSADGTVVPSVVCPQDGCPFHDFVRLDGWGATS